MPETVTEGRWAFLTYKVPVPPGCHPCGRPDWDWAACAYLDGLLKAGTSGGTREEAAAKVRRMASEISAAGAG